MEQKLIGAVKVNKPFEHLKNNYECAAWWEKQEALPGVYPVFVNKAYHYPHNLQIFAKIEAVVIDDYFPSLWGGVSVSNKPYVPKHVGERRTIRFSIDVLKAIESTGNSPGSDLDWFIDPKHWDMFMEEARQELEKEVNRLSGSWKKFQDTSFESLNDLDWNAGSLSYNGGGIQKWANRIARIARNFQYHTDGHKLNSEYNRKHFQKNTEWAR